MANCASHVRSQRYTAHLSHGVRGGWKVPKLTQKNSSSRYSPPSYDPTIPSPLIILLSHKRPFKNRIPIIHIPSTNISPQNLSIRPLSPHPHPAAATGIAPLGLSNASPPPSVSALSDGFGGWCMPFDRGTGSIGGFSFVEAVVGGGGRAEGRHFWRNLAVEARASSSVGVKSVKIGGRR